MKKCNVCGTESEHFDIVSTNTFGAPDLDTRPSEMTRSTIEDWVQVCPSCGFCAPDISKDVKSASEIIKKDSYKQQLKDQDYLELANAFLCYSMIKVASGNFTDAGWAILHAAWVCDDKKKYSVAKKCRIKAAELFQNARQNNQRFAEQTGLEEAILVDLYRRSGQFELALKVCDETLKGNLEKIIQDILEFQKNLIIKKDTVCHTIDEVNY